MDWRIDKLFKEFREDLAALMKYEDAGVSCALDNLADELWGVVLEDAVEEAAPK